VTRRPTHSGGLIPWERLTFGLTLAGMAGLVALLTVGAVHAGGAGGRRADLAAEQPLPAGHGTSAHAAAGSGAARQAQPGTRHPAAPDQSRRRTASATGGQQHAAVASDLRLAARLGAALRPFAGHLAVGVADRATGAWAVYNGSASFRAAGLARADVAAGLLLRAQTRDTGPDRRRVLLACRLLRTGGLAARRSVWAKAGGAAGVANANMRLGLSNTTLTPAELPDVAGTTAGDQLRLLADLTSARSPLRPASRACELRLLRGHRRSWLRTVAAADGTGPAGLAGGTGVQPLWAVSGIGVLHRAGQELLVTVLTDGQPSRPAALAEVRSAVSAATRQVTAAPPAPAATALFPVGSIRAR
jgi:hypothetical protein